MISSKDLVTLLSLLSEDDKSLEAVSTTFYRTFNKIDHFKIGCAIYTMMKDGFIRDPTHRLISFYILFSLYKPDIYSPISSSSSLSSSSLQDESNSTVVADNNSSPPPQSSSSSSSNQNSSNSTNINPTSSTSTSPSPPISISNHTILDYPIVFNPFLPLYINELEKQINEELNQNQNKNNNNNNNNNNASNYNSNIYNSIEKHYLIYFLTYLPKDFIKKTSKEILKSDSIAVTNNDIDRLKLNEYKQFYLDRLPYHIFPSLKSIGISPSLFYFSNTPPESPINSNNNMNNNGIGNPSKQELKLQTFEPQFNRIAPPLYKPLTTIWINNSINHSLLLSPTMGFSSVTNSKKIVRDLMSKAIRGRLKRAQIQQIKTELESDPNLVLYSGLVPKKLPILVENNSAVAIEALLKLIHSPDFKEYFQVLISMEVNYRSMEVVNALATSVELPSHFIPMYINNCMITCNNIKDKARQQRSVRLVCVFIQSLIRNNIIDIKDLFVELQSFCLLYSKISREAISLYKLINDESQSTSISANETNDSTIDNQN
ncbi:hypothetical protein DLAC_11507 [Tieghemostelium lacteum]|uniref:CCR4-NOT transcription complex subunit 11 n=1 Tax=Tieghemostelium lacteum TaxID=361077 RepID=A0A152A599_TIELA|nr:hypothetical protein DLAC_11507 [Tieghemostelium lacteum]|eukprot:KYR01412.1 hypothetical protein DLAC_11507 [Tieghemostelium lacteum]